MARTPKVVDTTPIVDETTELTEKERVIQQAEDVLSQFIMNAPNGNLQPVDCDLIGYEGVRVWYRTNNKYAIAEAFGSWPRSLELPVEYQYRLWSMFIKRIEWPYDDLTPPTPDNLAPWNWMLREMYDLVMWMRFKGYNTALEQAAHPLS